MNRWAYRVTVHDAEEILRWLQEPVTQIPPKVYCDTEGICYFDAGDPFLRAIEAVLNGPGEQGWELVQVLFRSQQMICFWKRAKEAE